MASKKNWFSRMKKIEIRLSKANKLIYRDLKEAIDVETEYRKMVQTLQSYLVLLERERSVQLDIQKQLERSIADAVQNMRTVSDYILEKLNEQYQTSFQLEEIINEQQGYYYQWGIVDTLKRSGKVEKIYHQLLSEIIPKHPKDEHPYARSIKRKFYIHCGPTNSGKTYQSMEALKTSENGVFLAPLRLLALEVYEKMNQEGVYCDLTTGEEEIRVPFSNHVSSTIEKARYDIHYQVAVIDEGQMLADEQRGQAWTRAIIGLYASEIHICCALNAVDMIIKLIEDCGDEYEVINHQRQTPLIVEKKEFRFPQDVKKGDALIVFSRKMALQVASMLLETDIKSSIIYGNLPPETRRKQVDVFLKGETEVVVSTDAIGMGLNLPIRRVIFLESEKYDGSSTRVLTTQEVKQIAGRAGRRGMYDEGFVNTVNDKELVMSLLAAKDEKVDMSYIAPLESTIMNLPMGTIEDRLRAWTTYKTNVKYIGKVDISEQLELLEKLDDYIKESLQEHQLYKAIHIPFNTKNEDLYEMWERTLGSIVEGKRKMKKPKCDLENDLNALETYYRKIDLYYGFGKTFGLEIDAKWISDERERVSEKIHVLLKDNTNLFKKRCKHCSDSLEWNSIHAICDSCYQKRKRYM